MAILAGMSNEDYSKNEIALLNYCLKTDARLMAMQNVMIKALGIALNAQDQYPIETITSNLQKEINDLFTLFYQAMLERSEDISPQLAAQLLGESFPDLSGE